MEIYRELRFIAEPTSIALGYFDGVHIGHEKVILRAVSYKKMGLKPIILTFQQSPKDILRATCDRKITSVEEKIKIFKNLGIEALYIVDFERIKDITAKDFVKLILCDTLNVKNAVCGFNYTFGAKGKAGAEDLKILGLDNNINVDIIPPVKYKNEAVSSTRIRTALANNEIEDVKNMTSNF